MAGVRCALVIDDSRAARHRIGTILVLGGWQVHEASDVSEALRKAAHVRPDLVVAEASLRGGSGIGLVHMLRGSGSRARFVVVANRPTEKVRALAAAAGAQACLAKPVDPAEVLAFLRGAPGGRHAQQAVFRQDRLLVESARADQDDGGPTWAERQREAYLRALPYRLSDIMDGARAGDLETVAWSADQLSDGSARVGLPSITSLCAVIAAEARRGVVTQTRLMQLVDVATSSTAHAAV